MSVVKNDIPDPQPGTDFVLHDMPIWTEGGVYLLLHRALSDSICLTYGRDDLTARRDDEPPQAEARHSIDLYWVGDWRGKRTSRRDYKEGWAALKPTLRDAHI